MATHLRQHSPVFSLYDTFFKILVSTGNSHLHNENGKLIAGCEQYTVNLNSPVFQKLYLQLIYSSKYGKHNVNQLFFLLTQWGNINN